MPPDDLREVFIVINDNINA